MASPVNRKRPGGNDLLCRETYKKRKIDQTIQDRMMPKISSVGAETARLPFMPGRVANFYEASLGRSLGIANPFGGSMFGTTSKESVEPKIPRGPSIKIRELKNERTTISNFQSLCLKKPDNYYLTLLAQTPFSARKDLFATTVGSSVWIRDPVCGKDYCLEGKKGKEVFSYDDEDILPTSVAFTPKGKYLIVGTDTGRIDFWDISDPSNFRIKSEVKYGGMVSFLLCANNRVFVAQNGGWLTEIDPNFLFQGDRPAATTFFTYESIIGSNISSLVASPDGKTLAVAGANADRKTSTLKIFRAHEKQDEAIPSMEEKSTLLNYPALLKLAFSPDGRFLAAGTSKGDLLIFRVKDGVASLEKGKGSKVESPQYNVGSKIMNLFWIEEEKQNLIVATLYDGSVKFLPVGEEGEIEGNPTSHQISPAPLVFSSLKQYRNQFKIISTSLGDRHYDEESVVKGSVASGRLHTTVVSLSKKSVEPS